MSQWYFHTPGQPDRVGPLGDDDARRHVQLHRDALAWREGMQGWQPAVSLPEFGGQASPPPMPPPVGGRR
ncbi:MAG TPA: TIGR00266 family protein, partial [Stenotrophomonas sp.]|nr:TIGR00266 family protein [Stenotrophomonas sp.]